MDSGMHHGMMGGGQNMAMPPSHNNATMQHKMMMHMTFYWGKEALILFHGWPGSSTGMYVLALIFVFVLAMLIEWLSNSRIIKQGSSSHVSAGLVQTVLHTVRVGLAYMVMLAVMSFNVGVLLVAVAGHSIGFLVFGSRVFKPQVVGESEKPRDLPSMAC
ncbi:Copper transporter [Thalictrum thalictroides]|uniref:Copper transport protein n=1 Tax=Thalictrum thalictroides TaxID=46969 RepID=A0A7J6WAC0_THATH|nr:Copper transporter [Thalictrum thalictroides]